MHATADQIQSVVEAKTDWIRRTRARVAKHYPSQGAKTFKPGEMFWYLGEQYPLSLTDRQRPPLELDGTFLLSRSAHGRAKEVFIEWYREETRTIVQRLIDQYVRQYRFKVDQVRITSARTRWGSCSSKNNLNFTYRLCMAPISVVEYVVLHELAHLKIRNHSKAFWESVARLKPDYKRDKAWLKKNGILLTLD
jgi:predicted metal-dependent hydrolase